MNKKKILSVLLAVALLFSAAIPVSANNMSTNEQIESGPFSDRLLNAFSDGFGVMFNCMVKEYDGIRIEDYQVMSPVTFNGSTSVFHFPIANKQGSVRWILSIGLNEDGTYGATIGEDFAPLLNEVVKYGFDQIYLIQDDWTLYAVAENIIIKQVGSDIVQVNKNEISQPSLSAVSHIGSSAMALNALYTTKAIESYQKYALEVAETESVSATGTYSELTNYPAIYYGFGGLCWAATVASMVRYEKPTLYPNVTAEDIANCLGLAYSNGGTPANVISALNYYLGSPYLPTHVSRTLTLSEIVTVIDNNDPAYLRMLTTDETEGHGIALIGYDIGSAYTQIKIMDPAFPQTVKYCLQSASGEWSVFHADRSFFWRETVRLYYS